MNDQKKKKEVNTNTSSNLKVMDAVDGYQLNFSFNIRQINVFKQNKLLSDPNMIETMNKGIYRINRMNDQL